MPRASFQFICVAALTALAGCAGEIADGAPDFGDEKAVPVSVGDCAGAPGLPCVRIGVELPEQPFVDEALLLDACAMWNGVECYRAPPEEATVHLIVVEDECVAEENGSVVVGRLTPVINGNNYDVSVYAACMYPGFVIDYDAPIVRAYWRNVIAHEVGHGLGIWRHVAWSCLPEDADPINPVYEDENGPICGSALMNPGVNGGLEAPTALDLRAFGVRDDGHLFSYVLEADQPLGTARQSLGAESAHDVGCTLHAAVP